MLGILSAFFLLIAAGTPRPADTYPRQPVDVEHYRFALTLSDSTDRIVGEATVRMRLLAADIRSVTLDLADASAAKTGRDITDEDLWACTLPDLIKQRDGSSIAWKDYTLLKSGRW